MLYILPILFFGAAFLYAMAGFGGGSTYIALLAISGLPLAAVPVIALVCNLIVTSQGSYLLIKRGHAHWALLVPLLVGSIPCAFIGGAWRLPDQTFLWILSTALMVAGLAMLSQDYLIKGKAEASIRPPGKGALLGVGVVLGFVAGITGIGGGIYLAPVMYLLRWAEARTIATCTSLFIALNSMAGLAGQLTKGMDVFAVLPWWLFIACPVAVLIGGRLGTYFLVEKLPQVKVRLMTAIVILLVAVRLWIKLIVLLGSTGAG